MADRSGTTDAEQDSRHDGLRAAVQSPPPMPVPTLLLNGQDDGVERSPLTEEQIRQSFPNGFGQRTLPGVGHFHQREAPGEVARAVAGLAP